MKLPSNNEDIVSDILWGDSKIHETTVPKIITIRNIKRINKEILSSFVPFNILLTFWGEGIALIANFLASFSLFNNRNTPNTTQITERSIIGRRYKFI